LRPTHLEQYAFFATKTLKDDHVLFSSPKGAKHEKLKARKKTFRLSCFLPLRPSGMPILPDLLCWWALEVQQYVGTPTALHLRQTRQLLDLEKGGTSCEPKRFLISKTMS